MTGTKPFDDKDDVSPCLGVRRGLVAFGCLNVALGVIGAVLPVMPTTVFLLIALWAFSKSSPRFYRWLYHHPRLGRTVRDWHRHRVIPRRAKILAIAMMGGSLFYVTLFLNQHWGLPASLATVMALVAAFILSRPSYGPPEETTAP